MLKFDEKIKILELRNKGYGYKSIICYAVEIEEKFVDVGVKRFIDQVGSDKDVFLIRDGVKTKYSEVKIN